MNDLLNRPISPTLINKCIGVALLPVAMYATWTSIVALYGLDITSLGDELLFTVLPSVCMLVAATFCILFAIKAFRRLRINKLAIIMAFLLIVSMALIAALNAWFSGGSGVLTGDAAFAAAGLFAVMFLIYYLPVVLVAGLAATAGIIALSRSTPKVQAE